MARIASFYKLDDPWSRRAGATAELLSSHVVMSVKLAAGASYMEIFLMFRAQ